MSEQMFEDYKSKYLDMYEKIKNERTQGSEKVSILEDVDFELELIHKDEINVAYILKLLAKYKDSTEDEKQSRAPINSATTASGSEYLTSNVIADYPCDNALELPDWKRPLPPVNRYVFAMNVVQRYAL